MKFIDEFGDELELSDLLPCPFCGSHSTLSETHALGLRRYQVKCNDCLAEMHPVNTPGFAVGLWNRRAS